MVMWGWKPVLIQLLLLLLLVAAEKWKNWLIKGVWEWFHKRKRGSLLTSDGLSTLSVSLPSSDWLLGLRAAWEPAPRRCCWAAWGRQAISISCFRSSLWRKYRCCSSCLASSCFFSLEIIYIGKYGLNEKCFKILKPTLPLLNVKESQENRK